MNDTILTLLLSILPGALYAFIIWITLPYGSFNLKTSYLYIIFGILSIGVVRFIHLNFSFLYDDFKIKDVFNSHDSSKLHDYAFFNVALTEEFAKWLIFILITRVRIYSNKIYSDTPIATMVYCGMVSMGFAILESIHYSVVFGASIIYSRLFSAVVLHIEAGLIMGYWLAMIQIDNSDNNKSILSIIFKNNKKLKIISFTIVGLISAIFLHGLYDFNLFLRQSQGFPLMYTILGIGAFLSYIGAHHLITFNKKKII